MISVITSNVLVISLTFLEELVAGKMPKIEEGIVWVLQQSLASTIAEFTATIDHHFAKKFK